MSSAERVIGWDIGGAHMKAALVERGVVIDVMQVPCTLWLGLDTIDGALASVQARWPSMRDAHHAVTMTGEMVDLFADREAGVTALVEHLVQLLGVHVWFFAGSDWLEPAAAIHDWQRVASANWLASAACVALRLDEALLIDIGSTTTDVVPVRRGRVVARGRGDAARLETGELVYQGVVRTPLCALAQRVHFGDRACNVMNEWFATAADVYRLTGELDTRFDQHDTADRRGKDRGATCARLARMIGRDAREADAAEWLDLAQVFRGAQLRLIEESVERVLAASALSVQAPVVAAGCGDFLAREIAQGLGRRCVDFDRLLGATGDAARCTRICAPSVAVAVLFSDHRRAEAARLVCGS
ncbi:MAG TPA: hydantoinase/oxoprolinase family protein [Burkholderiaceae bacterium]|nr:hydantoinase/oxoprolinase family protein [Burkholderiaceae bacterium]